MLFVACLSPLSAQPIIKPITIEKSYLEGRGLTKVDPSEFDGENVTRDDDFTSESSTHEFYTGKIFVAVYEAGPGRVYIDGAVSEQLQQEPQQPAQRTEQQNKIYLQHLMYEYGNRGRTYIGMEKAAKHSVGSDREAFFQAYYEMEIINQKILEHMKSKLGVDYQTNWLTRTGINVMTYFGWRFVSPQQLIDVIIPYLPKLKEMESLANSEHKLFFAYIVAQEQAQLDASRAAKQESWDSGAKVLKEFLPQAEAELQRLLSSSS